MYVTDKETGWLTSTKIFMHVCVCLKLSGEVFPLAEVHVGKQTMSDGPNNFEFFVIVNAY